MTLQDLLDKHGITKAIVGVVGNEGYIADIRKDRYDTLIVGDVVYESSSMIEVKSTQIEQEYNRTDVAVSIQKVYSFKRG